MTFQVLKDLNKAPAKTVSVTIEMPDRQALLLKQYCDQHGLSPYTVVLAALCAMIEGFEQR
jgi:hypothetical protein